jgi:hypothetical protein
MIDQEYLNNYFGTTWRNTCLPIESFEYTGLSLANKVTERDHVLDVGCGLNPFKGLVKNLVGIDPAFDEADYKMTLEEFTSKYQSKFNVAFCLGSINFGTREDIESQIEQLISLLDEKSRIYWRCNPGIADHNNQECKGIPFYHWTIEEHVRLSLKYRYELIECRWDSNNRIYAEWKR